MIFKAVGPAYVMPGDRMLYLGRLRTVSDIATEAETHVIRFACGTQGRFVNDVSLVDEERTAAMLARYSSMNTPVDTPV
jgi:hypothetical protein